MSDTSGGANQVISLPKGGGALKGIGEKFGPDLHTGTGNFTQRSGVTMYRAIREMTPRLARAGPDRRFLSGLKAFAVADPAASKPVRLRWQPSINVPASRGRADSGDLDIDLTTCARPARPRHGRSGIDDAGAARGCRVHQRSTRGTRRTGRRFPVLRQFA